MDSLGNNRFQLLYIDDEGSDLCLGELKLQESNDIAAHQKLLKRAKSQADKTKAKALNKKASQQKLGNARPDIRNNNHGAKDGRVKGNLVGKLGKKVTLSVEHQLSKQHKKQQLEPHRGKQLDQHGQQSQEPFKERNYREAGSMPARIIHNSNAKGAYGKSMKPKFDRRSGSDKTGVKPMVKRNGGGAHNWGSAIKDIEEQSLSIKANTSFPDKDEAVKDVPKPDNYLDDDIKYITVEEWRSKRAQRAKPVYNTRKAGEGEINRPDWKKMVVLQKKPPQKTDRADNGLEYDPSMYPQRVGRQQRITDIDFKFKDDRRRPFGGYKGGWTVRQYPTKSQTEGPTVDPINVADEIEFPTLN